MYKILIKYTSILNKIFWESYTVEDEDGNIVEWSTIDFDELKEKVKILDKEIGFENIRVIYDLSYDVLVNIDSEPEVDIVTDEDIDNIYTIAYDEVFNSPTKPDDSESDENTENENTESNGEENTDNENTSESETNKENGGVGA